MKKLAIVLLMLWVIPIVSLIKASPARAASVIVGPNVLGVDQISDAQQEALIEQLQENGVKTIRTGLGGHGDKYTAFVIKAFQHGIGSVVIVSPFEGIPANT